MQTTVTGAKDIIVGMADLKVGKQPDSLTTNLGSCIGVCMYSDRHQAGGLLHLMLDYAGDAVNKPGFKPAKYADTGISALLQELRTAYGLHPRDLRAKIFGGGKILKDIVRNIGLDNENAVRKILREYGIPIIAAKTGGEKGYRIRFDLNNGKVMCQIFGQAAEEF